MNSIWTTTRAVLFTCLVHSYSTGNIYFFLKKSLALKPPSTPWNRYVVAPMESSMTVRR